MEGSRQGGAVRGRVDGPLTHLERPSEHLGERREDRAGKREPARSRRSRANDAAEARIVFFVFFFYISTGIDTVSFKI